MFYTLNNQFLLLRDIENFSKENYTFIKKPENKVAALLNGFITRLVNLLIVNTQLHSASNYIKRAIKRDYAIFLVADERGKEDILIKWESLGRTLNGHTKNVPNEGRPATTKNIVHKTNTIINTVQDFINKLSSDLYPNIDAPLSQEYLKGLSKKFSHLPKEMLASLVYDGQTDDV